jgi:hypothetical protein
VADVLSCVQVLHQAPTFAGDYRAHLSSWPSTAGVRPAGIPAGPEVGGGNFLSDTSPERKPLNCAQADVTTAKPLNAATRSP